MNQANPILMVAGLFSLSALGAAQSMATGENGFTVSAPLLTIGETLSGTTGALNGTTAGDYTPVGVLDGMGAYQIDADTVRLFTNHELLHFRGNAYEVSDGQGGTFTLTGARISYFDIDRTSREIVDAGLAYDTIIDAVGSVASDNTFLQDGFSGLSRFCSGGLVEAGEYGMEDTIYFAGEEDGGAFNSVGGAMWALDCEMGVFYQVPSMGHGAWENITPFDTDNPLTVGFILADDSSPFDFDDDGTNEAAPLYMYIGLKLPFGGFLVRNGLEYGVLYVWKSDSGETTPLDFNGSTGPSTLRGRWVPVDNLRRPLLASENGESGYDEFGYPTQGNLWLQARDIGAFGFSRPEDVAVNPADGRQVVLASTGVDTYAVDGVSGNGVDTFGTLYRMTNRLGGGVLNFAFQFINPRGRLSIIYDGDADPTRALRSPDNLDWADDGFLYVQEDEAEEDTLSGDEVLFGPGAANPNEASIVRVDPTSGATTLVAQVDRSVVLDGSLADPTQAVDVDAGFAGEWESSGIIDVSTLFGQDPGTLFLFNVQAHGIEDQDTVNPTSRINDGDLVEGGQLLFLSAPK